MVNASRPLSELDAVDWASLQHAYGVATDTPALLRRLDAGDKHADFDVCSFLWHQGTVYSATAPAIPFMLDMVARGRGDLLPLLNMLAHGNGYYLVHERDPVRRASPEMQAILREEQGWIDAARLAVERGADIYRPYLLAPEPEIRAGAAALLTLCIARRPEVLDWLTVALAQEKVPAVRARMLEAAYREGSGPRLFARLSADLSPDDSRPVSDPALRFWVAALTVQTRGRNAPGAVQVLLDALDADQPENENLYVDRIVGELLTPLGERDRVATAILSRSDILRDSYAFLDLFRAELPWSPQHLHPLLREWLERYLQQEFILVPLEDYGLPVFREDLREWLGQA